MANEPRKLQDQSINLFTEILEARNWWGDLVKIFDTWREYDKNIFGSWRMVAIYIFMMERE